MAGKPAFVLFIVMTLAACGGGGGVPETTGPTGGTGSTGETGSTGGTDSTDGTGSTGGTESTGESGTGPATGPMTDPALQPVALGISPLEPPLWTISDSGVPGSVIATRTDRAQVTLTSRVINIVAPGFEAYEGGSTINAVRGVTPSGEGAAYAVYGFAPGPGGADAVAERLSETTVPASGSASFVGSYMALWVNLSPRQLDAHLLGSVTLLADFDAQRIEGVISNRRTTGSGRFRDIALLPADIVDGAFRGGATGGALDNAGGPARGRYSGLLVGRNAPEVVGNVVIVHRDSPERVEYGAFIASDPAAPALP